MKPDTASSVEQQIILPKLNLQHMTLTLEGDTPLICHAWSEKAKKQMRDKQMKKAKIAKEAKNPEQDFYDSLYMLDEKGALVPQNGKPSRSGRYGFRTIAFKAAAVGACSHVDGVTKVQARGAFHIDGEFVRIEGPPPVKREDMVRIGMGVADLRYRGAFEKWKVSLSIRYNANVLSAEQIVNLFNTAGFAIGVGEWRPEKDGSFGMFHGV